MDHKSQEPPKEALSLPPFCSLESEGAQIMDGMWGRGAENQEASLNVLKLQFRFLTYTESSRETGAGKCMDGEEGQPRAAPPLVPQFPSSNLLFNQLFRFLKRTGYPF